MIWYVIYYAMISSELISNDLISNENELCYEQSGNGPDYEQEEINSGNVESLK